MLSKLFSYLIPVNILKKKSGISKSLEVTWNNGELVLDSENTNYSYGSLQRILRKGLKNIGYQKIQNFKHILVLGVAGGSVIKSLIDEVQYPGKITGVEIDKDIIEIANQYFSLDKIPNLETIIDDAAEFVHKTDQQYDLIIVDIFQDTEMPGFLFEENFVERIKDLVIPNGYILFNTMVTGKRDEERNETFAQKYFDDYEIRVLPKIEVHNELFIIKKLS